MKRIITVVAACLCTLFVQAQLYVGYDGKIYLGDSISHTNASLLINGYRSLLWDGSYKVRMGYPVPEGEEIYYNYLYPVTLYGNVRFYNVQKHKPNTLVVGGIGTMEEFEEETTVHGVLPGLNQVLGLSVYDDSIQGTIGFNSDEVTAAIPEITTIKDGHTYVNTAGLITTFVNTYQQLQRQADSLENEVKLLKERMSVTHGRSTVSDINDIISGENKLYHGSPNPFMHSVSIRMNISQAISYAYLRIVDMNGRKVMDVPVNERGKTHVRIDGEAWHKGLYLASLIVDGHLIGTVKLNKK